LNVTYSGQECNCIMSFKYYVHNFIKIGDPLAVCPYTFFTCHRNRFDCNESRIKFVLYTIEVPTAVVMKNIVFWDITPCSSLKSNRRVRGTYRLHNQGRISRERYQRGTCFHAGILLGLFHPADGSDMFLRNVG
jgi:hypothetical protein